MAAFEHAVELGFSYVETDVHATADGVLLAFHDDTLDRVTDARGRVAALPWAAVRRARIAGQEPIPRLDEVLDAWPHIRVNVDVKRPEAIGPLLDVLRRTRAVDRVCVGSFSDARLRAVRSAAGPGLATSLGPCEVAALRAACYHESAQRWVPSDVACVQVPVGIGRLPLVDERFVATAHRLGLQVHVWTVDEPTQMHRLLDLGVDGILTDDLEVLRDVLTGRGCWQRADRP
jgi:glycerophosphoryl diester phosphodiesterase